MNAALAQERKTRRKKTELADLLERLKSLTSREREVLALVVTGILDKQAPAELRIGEVTFAHSLRQDHAQDTCRIACPARKNALDTYDRFPTYATLTL
jgi:FixJ family two-component response regulator